MGETAEMSKSSDSAFFLNKAIILASMSQELITSAIYIVNYQEKFRLSR